MDLGLNGKKALIMGASQGIGQAIAKALAAEGCAVTLAARNHDKLEATAQACREMGVEAEIMPVDLTDASSRQAFIEGVKAAAKWDVLIANAGGPPPGMVPGIAPDTWRSQFESMVLSLMEVIEAALPGMRTRGFGRIQIISSSGILIPIPKLAISNTLRSALSAYAKTLAEQVAADGVTVNLMLPGRIDTDRVKQLDSAVAQAQGITPDAARTASIKLIPTGRYGRPEEFGAVSAFYASEQAAYLTGNQIRIDGGLIKAI